MALKTGFRSFFNLFFPRCCIVCDGFLAETEAFLCVKCNMDIPRTNFHLQQERIMERLFQEQFLLVRATSFFFYTRGSRFNEILYQLKYKGNKELGGVMGRYMATELLPSGFFDGMDMFIPIPLHPKKMKLRGYNQSEQIAQGLSHITGIPVITSHSERGKNTDTQTRKSAIGRQENIQGVFRLHDPSFFTMKHVLIVDDVLTTGATIAEFISAFQNVEGVRISVFTMAVTHWE
jgi:ComF family protein